MLPRPTVLHPRRTCSLHVHQQVRNTHGLVQRNQEMNMITHSTRMHQHALHFAAHAPHVSKQLGTNLRSDHRLTVLRRKRHVNQNARQCVGHDDECTTCFRHAAATVHRPESRQHPHPPVLDPQQPLPRQRHPRKAVHGVNAHRASGAGTSRTTTWCSPQRTNPSVGVAPRQPTAIQLHRYAVKNTTPQPMARGLERTRSSNQLRT